MIKSIRDIINGWWRKLNQPLVFELPRSVIWVSFITSLLFLTMILIVKCHAYSASFQAVYGANSSEGVSFSGIGIVFLVAFFAAMDGALLFSSNAWIYQSPVLQWYKKREVRMFTMMRPFTSIIIFIFLGLLSFAIISTMIWSYQESKKDILMLEEMKSDNLSLDDAWLKIHEISMIQYAGTRQKIIDSGWDYTNTYVGYVIKEGIFFSICLIFLLSVMFIKTCTDIYFVWYYYPRRDRSINR